MNHMNQESCKSSSVTTTPIRSLWIIEIPRRKYGPELWRSEFAFVQVFSPSFDLFMVDPLNRTSNPCSKLQIWVCIWGGVLEKVNEHEYLLSQRYLE